MPRTKTPTTLSFDNIADFCREIDRIALLQHDLDELMLAKSAAEQVLLDIHEPAIIGARKELDAAVKLCERYATIKREELLPKGRKSAETIQAIYGFRLGQPTLKPISKMTWGGVVEMLKSTRRRAFLRVKYEPVKDSIIAKIKPNKLAKIGLKLVQDESFFVKSKATEL